MIAYCGLYTKGAKRGQQVVCGVSYPPDSLTRVNVQETVFCLLICFLFSAEEFSCLRVPRSDLT